MWHLSGHSAPVMAQKSNKCASSLHFWPETHRRGTRHRETSEGGGRRRRPSVGGGPGSGKPDGTRPPEDFVNTSICDLCKCVYVNMAIATGLLTGPQKQYESLTVGGWALGGWKEPGVSHSCLCANCWRWRQYRQSIPIKQDACLSFKYSCISSCILSERCE